MSGLWKTLGVVLLIVVPLVWGGLVGAFFSRLQKRVERRGGGR